MPPPLLGPESLILEILRPRLSWLQAEHGIEDVFHDKYEELSHYGAWVSTKRWKLGAIFIKHLRQKFKLTENFGTELQQNQSTIQFLKILVGCRSNSVFISLSKLFSNNNKKLEKLKRISLFFKLLIGAL